MHDRDGGRPWCVLAGGRRGVPVEPHAQPAGQFRGEVREDRPVGAEVLRRQPRGGGVDQFHRRVPPGHEIAEAVGERVPVRGVHRVEPVDLGELPQETRLRAVAGRYGDGPRRAAGEGGRFAGHFATARKLS